MTDKKSTPNLESVYIHDIEYQIDREGTSEILTLKEIPFDVYKSAKGAFHSDPEKSMQIIVSACADDKSKPRVLEHLSSNNFVVISSLESGIAKLISPIPAILKKK